MDDDIRATTVILAVSVDDREHQQMMIDRVAAQDGHVIRYTLLSDPGHRVIDRYGILNTADPEGRAIPHPTTLVIDTAGVVRWKMTEVNYKIRPTNEDILKALAALR